MPRQARRPRPEALGRPLRGRRPRVASESIRPTKAAPEPSTPVLRARTLAYCGINPAGEYIVVLGDKTIGPFATPREALDVAAVLNVKSEGA